MPHDVASILFALATSTVVMAVALPAVMGQVGRPARCAQIGVGLQAAGWALLLSTGAIEAGSWLDRGTSTLSMACLSFGLAFNAAAFDLWRGQPAPAWTPGIVAGVLSIGYGLGFSSYSFRFAWANGLLALEMGVIAVSLARRSRLPVGRWRWLLLVALVTQLVMTTWRGALGAFFSPSLPGFAASHPVNVGFALVANATSMLSMVGVLLAHRDEAGRELVRLATLDGLTNVLNRRAWLVRAHAEMAVSVRYDHPLAVLMIDVDHFKRVNDTHGHEAGDRALQYLARALQASVRAGDIVGRYGGEEFCVLMNHAGDDATCAFDRRMRSHLGEAALAELGFPLDFSAGIAQRSGAGDTLEAMLRRADAMLYRAKEEGRARTVDARGLRLQAA